MPNRYTIIAQLSPPKLFGLPDGDWVVVPARAGSTYGPVISRRGVVVGRGTLPEYRPPDHAIKLTAHVLEIDIEIEDDFIQLTTSRDSESEAIEAIRSFLDDFVRLLAVRQRTPVSYDMRLVRLTDDQSDDGRVPASPQFINLFRVHGFDLESVAANLSAAASEVEVVDNLLDRALEYFGHGMWLFTLRSELRAQALEGNFRQLISSAFLNLWKAIAVIVGEPPDRDYQSRYRQWGISEDYFRQRIEAVRKTRNDYDVAHYALNDTAIAEINKQFDLATRTSAEVIEAYINTLTSVNRA